jgi:hypothetical protein
MCNKHREETVMIEQDVYKNVVQRAGWALPKPFLYLQLFFTMKRITNSLFNPMHWFHGRGLLHNIFTSIVTVLSGLCMFHHNIYCVFSVISFDKAWYHVFLEQ